METPKTSKVTQVETLDEVVVLEVGDIEQPIQPQHTIAADRQEGKLNH